VNVQRLDIQRRLGLVSKREQISLPDRHAKPYLVSCDTVAPGRASGCCRTAKVASRSEGPPSGLITRISALVANIKSQKKRILTNEKAHVRNKAVKSELKTRVKVAVRTATAEPGSEESVDALRLAVKRLDKAATKGIIHKNQAANRKSSLMKRITKLSAPAS
jgi:small subunit ribosomal protein S20